MGKIGVPNDKTWPGCQKMMGYNDAVNIHNQKINADPSFGKKSLKEYLTEVKNNNRNDLAEDGQHHARHLDDAAIDLILKMLEFDPKKRITAKAAL